MPDLLNLDKTGKDAVDEMFKDLKAAQPEITSAIDYLIAQAKAQLLIGRKITITIT